MLLYWRVFVGILLSIYPCFCVHFTPVIVQFTLVTVHFTPMIVVWFSVHFTPLGSLFTLCLWNELTLSHKAWKPFSFLKDYHSYSSGLVGKREIIQFFQGRDWYVWKFLNFNIYRLGKRKGKHVVLDVLGDARECLRVSKICRAKLHRLRHISCSK